LKKIEVTDGFWAILFGLGGLWLKSGWGKVAGGTFASELASTLVKFASNNPYPWYKEFLLKVAVPNSFLMGLSVQWGEVLVGLGLMNIAVAYYLMPQRRKLVFVLLILTAGMGFILNASLWLASAWTSASTEMVGLVMMLIQVVAVVVGISEYRASKKG
jgi:hypothetical protein